METAAGGGNGGGQFVTEGFPPHGSCTRTLPRKQFPVSPHASRVHTFRQLPTTQFIPTLYSVLPSPFNPSIISVPAVLSTSISTYFIITVVAWSCLTYWIRQLKTALNDFKPRQNVKATRTDWRFRKQLDSVILRYYNNFTTEVYYISVIHSVSTPPPHTSADCDGNSSDIYQLIFCHILQHPQT